MMALEASIVERLQELRRWQVQQQERLLQHQQEQRETLSREQVRMYQALGLSVHDISSEGNRSIDPVFKDSLEENCVIDTTTKRHENLLRILPANADHVKHLPSQKQHELPYDSSLSSPHQHIVPEKKSPETPEATQLSKYVEKQLLDLCIDDSLSVTARSDASDNLDAISSDKKDSSEVNFRTELKEACKIIPELLIEGVEPLPPDNPKRKSFIIDDIPVPSPKKDFHTLLEERLRESQLAVENEKSVNGTNAKKSVKRPFLKKGEGLARFKLGAAACSSSKRLRPRTMSLPSTVKMESVKKNVKAHSDKPGEISKSMKKVAQKKVQVQKNCSPNIPNRAQSRLSLKNVKPPVRVRSKSMCNPREPQLENVTKHDTSDIESKTKRELEEVRIFELLEEKAENSSFCSTSSTVVALLQQSVQSTPLKSKSVSKNKVSTLAQKWRSKEHDINEDLLLAEIVYTTQSNNSATYMKHQQREISENSQPRRDVLNLENQATDKYEMIEIFDENSAENICELPYGTDVDPNYGTDYQISEEANGENERNIDHQVNYEKNTSLHVRFSEYNEYKTIGLTDTSTISTVSEASRNYSDQRAWSDCSITTDSSDAQESTSVIGDDDHHQSLFDRATSLEGHRSMEMPSKVIQPRHMNANNYTNHYYNDNFASDLNQNQQQELNAEQSTEEHHGDDINISDSASENYDKNDNSEAENEGLSLADATLIEEELASMQTGGENGLIFKSELLKIRLLELEQEIEIFRKENIAAKTLKEKLQEERKALERNLKEKEACFEERKQRLENAIQEERKRLTREKAALENRLKDAHVKAQQNKQERQEVQSLKDQLEELRDEMNQKESRWNAAQARHRSQVRILQSENSKLKQEVEKLQNMRRTTTRSRLHSKSVIPSNTKAIHRINKALDSQKHVPRKQDSSSDEDAFLVQPMIEAMHLNDLENENCDQVNSDGSKMIVYDRSQLGSNSKNCTTRKRDLYENLLKDATIGLKESEEATQKAVRGLENEKNSIKCNELITRPLREANQARDLSDGSNFEQGDNLSKGESEGMTGEIIEIDNENGIEDYANKKNSSLKTSVSSKETIGTLKSQKSPNVKNGGKVDKQGIKEVQHADGRVEFWYPNGNVKKISADGMVTKLIYYNGDVCESRKDGSVKYFYATTRTWHTTMPDGLEILEFPDGQMERRSKDGTVEVSFPDGSVRILQSNGTEKWALPDGTLAETSADGEKLLILPNGQREVHTKDHKRREYPDGTVKLVYPDGSQETRYAGGRVRLKDKDGNLLMDSHHQ
ncbi:centromere protein J [Diprion similis]|uniref:centromere protein J n=1 Tax=Diprion similis TaxID=362088 RepID=UPI001EF7FFEA|nr:centromere protein J [Diprion similis]